MIGGSAEQAKAVGDSQIAAKLAFDVIDHVPNINPNASNTNPINRKTFQGEIEFKDVVFKYPTRQDLTVLKNFNYKFKAGKTTALVGPSGSGKSTII